MCPLYSQEAAQFWFRVVPLLHFIVVCIEINKLSGWVGKLIVLKHQCIVRLTWPRHTTINSKKLIVKNSQCVGNIFVLLEKLIKFNYINACVDVRERTRKRVWLWMQWDKSRIKIVTLLNSTKAAGIEWKPTPNGILCYLLRELESSSYGLVSLPNRNEMGWQWYELLGAVHFSTIFIYSILAALLSGFDGNVGCMSYKAENSCSLKTIDYI